MVTVMFPQCYHLVKIFNLQKIPNLKLKQSIAHLSKWLSDLKINGTQENVTFSCPAFHGLPCGVVLFDASVSFRNHKIEVPDWLLKNSSHSDGGF